MSNGERRRERLRRAHLYLVIDAEVDGRSIRRAMGHSCAYRWRSQPDDGRIGA